MFVLLFSQSPVAIKTKTEAEEPIREQEVIAVSHTVPLESFPNRLNKQLPDIKSKKDLSLAVYQNNYLPGLTNGQPTVLSSSQIDLEDEAFQSEANGRQESPKMVNGQRAMKVDSPSQDSSHLGTPW